MRLLFEQLVTSLLLAHIHLCLKARVSDDSQLAARQSVCYSRLYSAE